jgi:glycosyltransferase involved in cell wall biosynthesis
MNPLFRWIEHTLMPITDFVVVNSRYSQRTVEQTFPQLDPATIRLVYCGIDHEVFYPRTDLARNRQIVVVGTLNQFKRVDTIIRAFAILKQNPNFSDVTLLIKGKGVEKDALAQLIKELNITDFVQIIDQFYSAEQLANLLSSSSVFVHAAHNEPFGLSPIEALACVFAVQNDVIPPTINHFTDDPDIDNKLNFTFNTAQNRTVNYALSNTFGFGGHNACIIMKKHN